jgi:hypothetical protein
MKQLSNLQSLMFIIGGVLMVISVACFVFMWQQKVVSLVFLLGSVMFAVMQIMQSYDGDSITVKRLKKIMTVADLFFILSGMLMVDTAWQVLRPLFGNEIDYFNYVYNKWVMLLLAGAILEMYTMHRIGSELKR